MEHLSKTIAIKDEDHKRNVLTNVKVSTWGENEAPVTTIRFADSFCISMNLEDLKKLSNLLAEAEKSMVENV